MQGTQYSIKTSPLPMYSYTEPILLFQICSRLLIGSSVHGRHWLVCLWCWMADLLPPSWPHHVTHSLPPSLGNGPAGCRGVGPAPGALGGVSFKSHLPGCQRRLSFRLNNLLDWGLHSRASGSFAGECRASTVVSIDSLSLSTGLSSQNIHAYTGT